MVNDKLLKTLIIMELLKINYDIACDKFNIGVMTAEELDAFLDDVKEKTSRIADTL